MTYEGASSVSIREDGALVVETPLGEIIESAPIIYQPIAGRQEPGRPDSKAKFNR